MIRRSAAFAATLLPAIAAILCGAALATAAAANTLDDVRARGKLVCGVSEGLRGFSEKDAAGTWSGFDVDFCRAVATSALGDPAAVDYVPLSAAARFDALRDGKVDLLSRNSTWTLSRDLGLHLEFAGVAYYDGQGFLANAVDGINSALQLVGARICVLTGTTTETNAKAFFAKNGIDVSFVPFTDRGDARAAFAARRCDAYTADRSALAAERATLPDPTAYVILPDVISKEPLGPVTREGDPDWTGLVRWTLYGLIDAEEAGITRASVAGGKGKGDDGYAQAMAMGKPAIGPLQLADDWLVRVIAATGNYGEIFERNLGAETPLALARGVNALWTHGGILYAPPMQ